MGDSNRDSDMELLSRFRSGLAGLSMVQPADHPGDYWADTASVMTLVIEAWASIGPRVKSQISAQAITKLIDDAMDAFVDRDDAKLRHALSSAYSIWTVHEFTEQVKSTS